MSGLSRACLPSDPLQFQGSQLSDRFVRIVERRLEQGAALTSAIDGIDRHQADGGILILQRSFKRGDRLIATVPTQAEHGLCPRLRVAIHERLLQDPACGYVRPGGMPRQPLQALNPSL